MPRLKPPPGYLTSKDAAARLGVSDAMLYRHVEQGHLNRYGPPERMHKFYKESEIESLLASRHLFTGDYIKGSYKQRPTSTFELATEADMPTIVDISARIFDSGPPIPAHVRLNWLHKNAETFYVLRDQAGVIVGYASLLPLAQEVIHRFIRDEIEAEDISGDDVQDFTPGGKLHLYVMAIGVDPVLSAHDKHEYGARLVSGLFTFLLDLAARGIDIETITARSYKPDGLRLVRKMGFPQLHSPVPGKQLFQVNVRESGFYLFERYTTLLTDWKRAHAPKLATHPPPAQRVPHVPHVARTAQSELPAHLVGLSEYAAQLGIPVTTLKKAAAAGRIPIVHGYWKIGRTHIQLALDEDGRAKVRELYGK